MNLEVNYMIKLNQIMPIDCPSNYKMHIAKYNGNTNPLDDFIENFDYWVGWNTWRSEKTNRFTRRYVISFIDFYPQKGTFLFGGIFEILNTYPDHYDIRLCDEYKDFIGRLKVKNINTSRGSAFFFENYYDVIEVVEVLDKSYSSHIFPGYEQIDFPFATIKTIINRNPQDWKSALESIKASICFPTLKMESVILVLPMEIVEFGLVGASIVPMGMVVTKNFVL